MTPRKGDRFRWRRHGLVDASTYEVSSIRGGYVYFYPIDPRTDRRYRGDRPDARKIEQFIAGALDDREWTIATATPIEWLTAVAS